MWWAGTRSGTLWVQQLAVLTIFPALLLTIMGMPVLRILAWPVAFIGFALPVGTSADPWLQALTARFIVTGLSALGIPHHQDGLLISLPSGIWEVEPDCSGLRYLLPGLALAYACTVLIHDTVRQRAGFLAVCAVSLILANGLRALSIILAAHLGIGMGADHRVFSYSIYGLTVVSLGWLGLRWNALTRTRALSQRPTAA
jgi:exosortase